MGFLPSGVRDLKFKHRFKYCICNKIMRHENLEHSLASIGVYRGFPTPVNRSGCPNYVPKLMKNSLEKISLIQILGNKIFIAIVSKHCKKCNFMVSLFFLKKNNYFHVMSQPVFCIVIDFL